MKRSISKIILETILEAGIVTLDIFFPPQYAHTRFSRRLLGLDSYPEVSRRTFIVLLSRLKSQGLVKTVGQKKLAGWRLTSKGEKYTQNLQSIIPRIPEKDGISRLVIFDIPERERKKRDQLREKLASYDFEQLQKSVWIGFNPLPEGFITFLDDLNLGDKVHIFSVKDGGTLGG